MKVQSRSVGSTPSVGQRRGDTVLDLGKVSLLNIANVKGTSPTSTRDASGYGLYACSPSKGGVSAVETQLVQCLRLGVMKKRLLISGIVLAALLLALYGVVFGTGAK